MEYSIINRAMLALALLGGAVPTAGAADRFYNSGSYVAAGESGTLVFSLDNDKKYYGFQTEIELPENYEFVTVNGKVDAQLTDRASAYSIVSNMVSKRKVKIGAFSANHEAISGSTGALLNLRVKASAGFAGGTLTITNPILVDATDNDVKLQGSTAKYAAPDAANIKIDDFDIDLGGTAKVNVTYSGSGINGYKTAVYLPAELSLVEGSVTPASTAVEKLSDGGWLFSSSNVVSGRSLFEFSVTSMGAASGSCEIELKNQAVTLADGTKMFTPDSRATANVKAVEVSAIQLNHYAAEIKVGENVILTATVLPENATVKAVTWTSSNTSVATVDANGKVTAIAVGESVITAKCGEVSATCEVTVVPTPAASVTLNRSELSLKATETFKLEATVSPATTTDKTVTWTSSNEAVATVDANGNVTAVAVGDAVITAKCGEVSATCEVTVVPTPAGSITLDKTVAELKATETIQLTATILPETTTDKTVTWTSSNTAVATVDVNGQVTAVAVGDAVITAKCGEVSATCEVTVVPTPAGSITLDKTSAELKATETIQLTATILPETTTDKTVTWTSSNTAVATVDVNGQVTAVAVGDAVITAKCGEVSATCEVTVVPTPAGSITLDKTVAELKATETVQLTATILPETTTDKTVTWRSSNESVATVDRTGKVTAIAVGKANITATAVSGISATCEVTVVPTPVESISFDIVPACLKIGESGRLGVTILPENATDKTVTWSSSNEAIISIDANGYFTAVGVGIAEITAKCGEVSATCSIPVEAIEAERVTLNQSVASLKVGESVTLTATVSPETTTDKTVTWASSNTAVATVDANGKVTAVALGEATITAKCGEASATCAVKVVPTEAQRIEIINMPASLWVGESIDLIVRIEPENTTDKTVTWSSSNEAVATVDANGRLTAIGVGYATITARCGNIEKSFMLNVIICPADSVTLSQITALLKVGESVTLTATVSPETTTDKTVTWRSSNESVATVDQTGKVTAIAVGKANISATAASGISATCEVTVIPTPAASVTLNRSDLSLKATETIQLTATILPETTTDKTVTWRSSNESVATVDQTGKVTAIAVGKANISATAASGISATCEVTVIPTPAASVTLNRSDLSLKATETFKLEATVSPETTTDKTVTWTSSNTAVATVDANGKVTAIAVGDAVITAKCGEVSATCAVKVVPTSAGTITLDKTVAELKATETIQLTATILPETTTNKTVTWESSNESVATVDQTGKVTAIAVGKANITATAVSGISATCEVTVVPTPAASLTLNRSDLSLKATETFKLEATVSPATTTDKTVTWASSNTAVATVDANGKVTAVALGEAIITASCGNVSATCEVTVVPTSAGTITLDKTSAELKATETIQLTATILPETTTDKTVTWKSSNESVATVDRTGKVTAIAVGKANITATAVSGISATCEVTVVPTPAASLTLNRSDLSLKATETFKLEATVSPATTTDKTVTWASSNTAVATVDANGKVTAVAVGKANISATAASGISATCEVTVIPTPAESVTLSEHTLDMLEGAVTVLSVVVAPDDATYKDVIWTSSDEGVVSVSQDGTLTAVAEGTATIRVAMADDATVYDECLVTVSKDSSAVDEIVRDDAPYEVYDLNGVKVGDSVDGLVKGLYIVRQGGMVSKIAR